MNKFSMVKKILKILSEKKIYYIFLFLKVSQCKFKLGNTLKSKSKFTKSNIGWGASICTLTRALHWTLWGSSDSAEFSLRLLF